VESTPFSRHPRTGPDVGWRELAGFRNVIVHGYLGVDLDAVWLVVVQDLPPLEAALLEIRGTASGATG